MRAAAARLACRARRAIHPIEIIHRDRLRASCPMTPMSSETQLWLIAFTGGLAGALFTQLIALIVYLVSRPRLHLVFASTERGCVVDTPAGANSTQRWLKIRVENRGWIAAHQVNVSAAEISLQGKGVPPQLYTEEVLDFPLALGEGRTTFDLAPGAHRFVAVFLADQHLSQAATARFAFTQTPRRFQQLGIGGVGVYSVWVIATAHNATARKRRINWDWNGTVAGLRIT
jgi:hypothetical protein